MEKKTDQNSGDQLRPEYDFGSMKGGVSHLSVSAALRERLI